MVNKKEVIQANIEYHSKMSEFYNAHQPHYRPENVGSVARTIKDIVAATNATRLADFGCGTGFIIDIAKHYVDHITGVDVTSAMIDRVDKQGRAVIELINDDTESVSLKPESYDIVTAYALLHHLHDIVPTLRSAYQCLRKGGMLYADLEPNYYFWSSINQLDRDGNYDPIVKREIESVTYKDEEVERMYGVKRKVANLAEFGKDIIGGFKEEELTKHLRDAGFCEVKLNYHWFIGEAAIINNADIPKEERFANAKTIDTLLQKALPISKCLYKYLGFIATK